MTMELRPRCPKCGKNLLVRQESEEPDDEDIAFCEEHGDIGTRRDANLLAYSQNEEAVIDNARKIVDAQLKKAGFKI